MLFSLIYVHGDLVTFSSSRVGPEPLLPRQAQVAGSLDHTLSSKGLGYRIMKQGFLCVRMWGSRVQP